MNDVRRLSEEADIGHVADYLGLCGKRTGGYTFIHCPIPGHNDRRATNCFYTQGGNHVYCTVCNRKADAIDLIQYTTGLGFKESCDVLWNLEGQPDWYYGKDTGKKQDDFFVNQKDLDFLGISLKSTVSMPVREYASKPFLNDDLPHGFALSAKGSGYVLEKRKAGLSWRDFLSERDMKCLVLRKCREKEKILDKAAAAASAFGVTVPFTEERKRLETLRRRAENEHGQERKAV